MKTYFTSISKIAVALFFMTSMSCHCLAQDPGMPGGDPDVPVDGVLCFFVSVAVILAVRKLKALLS